jgi:hypothetical protein
LAQRPGTFVVSPEGRLLYAHYHKDSADNPPIDEILSAVLPTYSQTSEGL